MNDDKETTGWLKDGDNWYYLYGDTGYMACGTTVDGYYLDDSGEWVPMGAIVVILRIRAQVGRKMVMIGTIIILMVKWHRMDTR